jgi:maleylpyruvate isomerase
MSDLARRLEWMQQGSTAFLAQLDGLADAAFGADSSLPGWTTAHLVAHVGYNAQALSRLVHWAHTGVETPMYISAEARNAEIEDGAKLPATELRALAHESDEQLRADLAALPSWDAKVVTAQGRTVAATEIPWMRTREVWIHGVDLGGLDFEDFDGALVDALITDITAVRNGRQQHPAVLIEPDDRDRTWQIGTSPITVRGRAADLARWLAGRGARGLHTEGGGIPELGRWL